MTTQEQAFTSMWHSPSNRGDVTTSRRAPGRMVLLAATACILACLTFPGQQAAAQELEPRSYVNTPVDINFLLAGYGYTKGNVVFGNSAPIEDAEVETHAGFLAYVRSIGILGSSGKIGVVVPYAYANGTATVIGQPREREVSGFGDPLFRLSVNLLGAPALTLREFESYRQDLIVGMTLDVFPPLGQYDSGKLLNIGTNRWAAKSELGVSKAFEWLTAEASAAVIFFTDNTDFLDGQTLKRAPLYAAQGHLVFDLGSSAWAALDATYYAGGRTTVEGVKGEQQENARLGLTITLPLSRRYSVKLFGSTGVYSRTGSDFDAVGIALQFRWGEGL